MTAARAKRPIAEIRIGKRHRRDLGDVDGLATSIAEIGILYPILLTPGGELIDGQRRLEACQKLGWLEVPVRTVDIDAIVRGELAANIYRKDFTPSEMVAIAATVEKRERELAKARQTASLKRGDKKIPVVEIFHHGKARDKIAAPLGVSGRTLEKARAIVAAAKAEPEKFGFLVENMDRTNKVNGVFKRLSIMKQAEAIRAEPPPLPGRGPYRVLVADPPWPYEIRREDPSHRATYPYPQMSLAEISALDVASIAAPDSILWLWTTNYHMLNGARDVCDAWGFSPVTILTWAKNKYGMGAWLRGQTEHCILATRGKPTVELSRQSTLLCADVRAHSQKPVEFYDLVESLCPAPRYAYLFSRYRHNAKWDCHGDEAPPAMEAAQ